MKTVQIQPPVWLLIFIGALPLLTDALYAPTLSDIARSLGVADALAQYAYTIYIIGYALGTFFLGNYF